MLERGGLSIRTVLLLYQMRGFGGRKKKEEDVETGRYKEDVLYLTYPGDSISDCLTMPLFYKLLTNLLFQILRQSSIVLCTSHALGVTLPHISSLNLNHCPLPKPPTINLETAGRESSYGGCPWRPPSGAFILAWRGALAGGRLGEAPGVCSAL